MPFIAEFQDFCAAAGAFDTNATPTTALFDELLASARRGEPLRQAVPIACLKQQIAARAWTDAALSLIALQAPHWKLRSLRYDDGEWHCALSRQREMPEWLDQSIEAHHPHIAMALLSALRETDPPPRLTMVPAADAPHNRFEPLLCENFA